MAKREIIKIDLEKCNGCGLCVPGCPEGALQIIDGKARLISDLFCDGLGACIGECPQGAITIEKREAEKYDEDKVMENIVKGGKNVIKAHLSHLQDHGQKEFLDQAVKFLKERGIEVPNLKGAHAGHGHGGCPGSKMMDLSKGEERGGDESGSRPSQLRQWPVQLHLISPMAPYFQSKDVLLAEDCVAFAHGDFHKEFLKGRSLIIACPKLDEGKDVYIDKIASLIDDAKINTLTVAIMEVPCCGGLLQIAKEGAAKASRKVPIKVVVIGINGEVQREDWV